MTRRLVVAIAAATLACAAGQARAAACTTGPHPQIGPGAPIDEAKRQQLLDNAVQYYTCFWADAAGPPPSIQGSGVFDVRDDDAVSEADRRKVDAALRKAIVAVQQAVPLRGSAPLKVTMALILKNGAPFYNTQGMVNFSLNSEDNLHLTLNDRAYEKSNLLKAGQRTGCTRWREPGTRQEVVTYASPNPRDFIRTVSFAVSGKSSTDLSGQNNPPSAARAPNARLFAAAYSINCQQLLDSLNGR